MNVRVCLKMILRRFFLIDSFCRICGRDVHDFSAPDWAWEKVAPLIPHGNTVCYDCFCALCARVGLPAVWKLGVLQ